MVERPQVWRSQRLRHVYLVRGMGAHFAAQPGQKVAAWQPSQGAAQHVRIEEQVTRCAWGGEWVGVRACWDGGFAALVELV